MQNVKIPANSFYNIDKKIIKPTIKKNYQRKQLLYKLKTSPHIPTSYGWRKLKVVNNMCTLSFLSRKSEANVIKLRLKFCINLRFDFNTSELHLNYKVFTFEHNIFAFCFIIRCIYIHVINLFKFSAHIVLSRFI